MAGYFFEVLETIREPDALYEGTYGELLEEALKTNPNDARILALSKRPKVRNPSA